MTVHIPFYLVDPENVVVREHGSAEIKCASIGHRDIEVIFEARHLPKLRELVATLEALDAFPYTAAPEAAR